MKNENTEKRYDFALLMATLAFIAASSNILVLTELDKIVITGEKDSKKVKLRFRMTYPSIDILMEGKDTSPLIEADCYVDNVCAYGNVPIFKETYKEIMNKIQELKLAAQKQFSGDAAFKFLGLHTI